ncbi:hypothetical protein KBC75_05065 [Candidatus Shapirobacteria bacterium]|nr:hypothetical protein [Candidatus Shapirobacteria bacterium]
MSKEETYNLKEKTIPLTTVGNTLVVIPEFVNETLSIGNLERTGFMLASLPDGSPILFTKNIFDMNGNTQVFISTPEVAFTVTAFDERLYRHPEVFVDIAKRADFNHPRFANTQSEMFNPDGIGNAIILKFDPKDTEGQTRIRLAAKYSAGL